MSESASNMVTVLLALPATAALINLMVAMWRNKYLLQSSAIMVAMLVLAWVALRAQT